MNNLNEHNMWLINNHEDLIFSGAIVEMSSAIVSNKQWQSLLNDVLKEFEANDDLAYSVNGSYAISFSSTSSDSYASMLVSKIVGESFEDTMTIVNLPDGSLGLMHIFNDPVYKKIAVLSLLAGDFSDKGEVTPNRIFASAFFGDKISAVRKNNISPLVHCRVLEIGQAMINNLDSSLIVQGYNS